jgi:sialic acid synthase SpsE
MKTIHVNEFEIGGHSTFIIADIGSNHKQDLSLAKESIDAAAEAGADAIKFQSIQLHELYLNPDPQTAAFIKQLEFPEDWHFLLKEYCDKKGVVFFSSPTYLKAVDLLEEINVPLYKLASAQVGTFPQIVDKVASLHKPAIFSTGIAAMCEIEAVVEIFKKHNNNQFIILHCNSIYPTPADRVNLPLMQHFAAKYPENPVGFSDHTTGTHTACAAVAMGAKVIEKHFTLDRNFSSPDSNEFACDPTELKLLVQQIRDIEKSIKVYSNRSVIEKEEQAFKDSIGYKIVAGKDLYAGMTIETSMLRYLRNNKGINCKDVEKVIGKILITDIKQNELIDYVNFTQ